MLFRRSVLFAATAAFSAVLLAGCNEESAVPRSGRHYVPMSLALQNEMREKNMRTHAPILIRAFKQESELEVWKQDASGKMALLKTFPMCRWSGQLGPKVKEGDRQVPEGFYTVSQGALNPNSSYYLSFNVGYPNNFDRQLGRTGNHIMVHGDCSSMGCFAMTDAQVADIYALTREAFAGGQSLVQMQSFPFRMTPENLAKYRNDPNIAFWKNLKQGNDHFEVTRQPVKTAACNGRYGFGSETCGEAASPDVVAAVSERQRRDDMQVAELVSKGSRAVKRVYRDGDMHPVFKDTLLAGNNRPVGTTRNGISRQDSVAFTPIELPVDQYKAHKTKGRSAMQIAELAQQEQINTAIASPDAAKPAETPKTEPAKAETARSTPPRAGATVATAAATPASQPTSTTALAAAPQEAPQRSAFQRMLGTVGLGATEETPSDAPKVEEITPHKVNVPLPPRRQAGTVTPGPQAAAPAGQVSPLISDTQRLTPSSLASGFSKLQ